MTGAGLADGFTDRDRYPIATGCDLRRVRRTHIASPDRPTYIPCGPEREAGSVIRQYLLCHNPGMSALLATLVGGALAIAGGLVGVFATDRRERSRWRRDAQLRISTELLSSLQEVIRQMIDLAYLAEKPPRGSPEYAAYHKATIGWNSSIYAALLVSPPHVVDLVQDLDREVDRLWTAHWRSHGRAPTFARNVALLVDSPPTTSMPRALRQAGPRSPLSPYGHGMKPHHPAPRLPQIATECCLRFPMTMTGRNGQTMSAELMRSPYRPRIRIVQPS